MSSDAEIARLQEEVERLTSVLSFKTRQLDLRTRQNTQSSEAWARAAEKALAGDPRALHDLVASWRDPSRLTARVVQSSEASHAR